MKIIKITACILFLLSFIFNGNAQYKENSILATGETYKLAVNSTGIYRIDKTFLESSLNLDIDNIDPRNISIYGNGGGLLPEALSSFRYDDLEENRIYISGEADGSFDQGDFILFYAQGADVWRYSEEDQEMIFEKNIYDLKNYYFLKINNTPGLRVEAVNSINNPDSLFTQTDVNIHYEEDLTNLLGAFSSTEGTGQRWYGEAFSSSSQLDFSQYFRIDNAALNEEAEISFAMAARSSNLSTCNFLIDNENHSLAIPQSSIGNVEASYAQHRVKKIDFTLSSDNPRIVIEYNGNSGALAWLDYIELRAKSNLIYKGSPLNFLNKSSLSFNTAGFEISNANMMLELWDISDCTQVKSINYNNNGNNLSFGYEVENNFKNFLLFDPNNSYEAPEFIEIVEQQNLHGLSSVEAVVVYYKDFEEEAIRLATHRAEHSNMSVAAVNINDVYNEFGSGRKDVGALRDFTKMLYDKFDQFNFLVLFGDASYDYRGIVDGLEYQNFIPTYETKESLSPIYGFPSDDYFALLSDNEGADNLRGALDISLGRLPARNIEDAKAMVDKIIHYETQASTFGEWKLNVGFAADDEDDNTHLEDSEEIANKQEANYPEYNQQKVYFDAYEQVSTPGGARYPEANEDINRNIEKGQLVLNYLGHGGPKGWAQERVIQVNDLNSWNNKDKMPIIVTATCSFTGYDDPSLITAGEHAISNAFGGSVALFTTVRAVFASENKRLASAVFDQLFEKPNGKAQRLGDILTRAKNANPQDTFRTNARKFTLIGDPTMTIALPKNSIDLLEINDNDIMDFTDTLSALSTVKLKGQISDQDDQLMSSFNGLVYLTVFDKQSEISTLANDTKSQETSFLVRKNVLFKGSASVTMGEFEIEFILPKDINFSAGEGKFSFYAHDGNTEDAAGYYDKIIIGGSSGELTNDLPPEIELFMNDEQFVNGGITNDSPSLLVKLKDDYGINVSGTSIGHDLTMVLDDQVDQTVVLNDFYEAAVNNYRSGSVLFPLKDLSVGMHQIRVKCWDISNNSNEATLDFQVVDGQGEIKIYPLNYPNPFLNSTNFAFEHDLGNEDVNIQVNIYTIEGKSVKSIETSRDNSGFRISDVLWDGTNHAGSRLASGIYIYNVTISSISTGEKRESEFGKLILL